MHRKIVLALHLLRVMATSLATFGKGQVPVGCKKSGTRAFGFSCSLRLLIATVLVLYSQSFVAAEPISVVQYNVQFLLNSPFFSNIAGHWPNTNERATAIGFALACKDIVLLNETLNSERRERIIETMQQAGTSCGKPSRFPDGSPFEVVNGPELDEFIDSLFITRDDELTILSRFPIISTHQHIYRQASGNDKFAAKGVLHARLWRGGHSLGSDVIDVFGTHLQAGDGEVRATQITELADFVSRHENPANPVLILGDFNIDGFRHRREDPNSEYNRSMQILRTRIWPLNDLGAQEVNGFRELESTLIEEDRRIDYILMHPAPNYSLSLKDIFVEPYFGYASGGVDGSLSDHASVEAEFEWHRGSLPASLLAVLIMALA